MNPLKWIKCRKYNQSLSRFSQPNHNTTFPKKNPLGIDFRRPILRAVQSDKASIFHKSLLLGSSALQNEFPTKSRGKVKNYSIFKHRKLIKRQIRLADNVVSPGVALKWKIHSEKAWKVCIRFSGDAIDRDLRSWKTKKCFPSPEKNS